MFNVKLKTLLNCNFVLTEKNWNLFTKLKLKIGQKCNRLQQNVIQFKNSYVIMDFTLTTKAQLNISLHIRSFKYTILNTNVIMRIFSKFTSFGFQSTSAMSILINDDLFWRYRTNVMQRSSWFSTLINISNANSMFSSRARFSDCPFRIIIFVKIFWQIARVEIPAALRLLRKCIPSHSSYLCRATHVPCDELAQSSSCLNLLLTDESLQPGTKSIDGRLSPSLLRASYSSRYVR